MVESNVQEGTLLLEQASSRIQTLESCLAAANRDIGRHKQNTDDAHNVLDALSAFMVKGRKIRGYTLSAEALQLMNEKISGRTRSLLARFIRKIK